MTIKIIVTMATKSIKQQEQQWQAESDARTMADYQQIINDKQRMNRAIKVAKQQASALSKRASAMQSVANTKAGKGKK